MKQLLTLLLSMTLTGSLSAQRPKLYLLPGMGGDERLFKNLDLSAYDTTVVRFPVPDGPIRMADYAALLHSQIDTTEAFSLLGVSLGGMLSVELAEQLQPRHVIIVSSAKTKNELPGKIRFNRILPLYRIIGGRAQRGLGGMGRFLFERRARAEEPTFRAMLRSKDPRYLKWTTYAVTHWERELAPSRIVHVQGTKDHTIPIKNISDAVPIADGGHMVIMMQPEAVEAVLKAVILEGK